MTSPDQIAIYTTPDGTAHVRLQLKDEGIDTHFGEPPHRSDMAIAKNYLLEDQARQMRRLATMFLDCAEDQARQMRRLATMFLDYAEDQAERVLKRGEDPVD